MLPQPELFRRAPLLIVYFLIMQILLISFAVAQDNFPKPTRETPAALMLSPSMMARDRMDRDIVLYSESHALLVGNYNYRPGQWSVLSSVPDDLRSLQTVLEAQGFHVIVYENLTGRQMEDVTENFLRQYGDNQTGRILVYYAGHGATLQQQLDATTTRQIGYLVPVDAPKTDDRTLFLRSAVRMSRYIEWASSIAVKHAFFIFDSCFSGAIFGARGEDRRVMPPDYVFSDSVNRPVRSFLTSGSADQTVPSESQFAKLLTQILSGERREADINNDGFLTGTELTSYIVPWTNIYSNGQTPEFGRLRDAALDRGDIIFRFPTTPVTQFNVPTPSPQPQAQVLTTQAALQPQSPNQASIPFAQNLMAETILTTGNHHCLWNCRGEPTRTGYPLQVTLPTNAPPNAYLDDLRLECVGGSACGGWYQIIRPPTLSADRKSADARIDVWSTPTTWRLRANVVVPISVTGTQVARRVYTGNSAVPDTQPVAVPSSGPTLDPTTALRLQSVSMRLEEDDEAGRRAARVELASIFAARPFTAEFLLRNLPQGSYRYQVGVAFALANVSGGWTAGDPNTARGILLAVRSRSSDSALQNVIDDALQNLRT